MTPLQVLIIENCFTVASLGGVLGNKIGPKHKGEDKTQKSQYKLLYGLHLCKKILLITDN